MNEQQQSSVHRNSDIFSVSCERLKNSHLSKSPILIGDSSYHGAAADCGCEACITKNQVV